MPRCCFGNRMPRRQAAVRSVGDFRGKVQRRMMIPWDSAGKQVEDRVNLLDPLGSLRNDRAQVPDRLWLTIRFNKLLVPSGPSYGCR